MVSHRTGPLSVQSQLYVCVSLRQLCVCVFRIVHTTLLVTSVIFVRTGMEGMPQREHGQTVNQTDLFQGASVTAEGVFELTVPMVNSVFARLVPCSYRCCKNVCSRITGDIVRYKHNSGTNYSFVMYSFLRCCNCRPCSLCSIIKHYHFNWELSVTCITCRTLSVCHLYFPVLYYYWIFPILSQNFSSAGWVFCPCQVRQIWGYSNCQFWPPGGCFVSLLYN